MAKRVVIHSPADMSKRGSDRESETSSNIGLDSVTLNRNRPLPEEWTLPTEWNIEQRETYDNWRLDLQSQIKNIDQQLVQSIGEFPTEDLGPYYNMHSPQDAERIRRIRQELLSGKMQKGVMRR